MIISGSSAFELRNRTNEPLTGRKFEYFLFPISYEEYEKSQGYLETVKDLGNRLIYGFYPDVINNRGEEREILNEIAQSYLFKDILSFANIRKPEIVIIGKSIIRSTKNTSKRVFFYLSPCCSFV